MADYTSIAEAQAAIRALPACASLIENPSTFVVYYPDGYKMPQGCLVKRGTDDLGALNLLYENVVKWWDSQRLKLT